MVMLKFFQADSLGHLAGFTFSRYIQLKMYLQLLTFKNILHLKKPLKFARTAVSLGKLLAQC